MSIWAVPGHAHGPSHGHRSAAYAGPGTAVPAYLSATELLSTRAVWPTLLMAILNLPSIAPPNLDDLYPGLAALSAPLGVLGVVAIVGLLRRVEWGTPLVLGVAVLNELLGELALVSGQRAGLVGITLGLLALALARPVPRRAPRY
ncbi:hypothetical protein [Nocardioides pocheonensis]|uniref:Uncharacterized protein n=1 Tax=Nocardioides pocheonensis TaxID=661485 RepID=A0A3N0GW33_9ACTN|nr:hypothetical protein [Nocardioides pocheonensis]RNM16360.1 hypothetical protein EFL26_05280 [Nocardioides pocheonensis]